MYLKKLEPSDRRDKKMGEKEKGKEREEEEKGNIWPGDRQQRL